MGWNYKKRVLERGKRILFIKTELNRLVLKSLMKNTFNTNVYSVFDKDSKKYKYNKKKSKSYFRLYCFFQKNSKLMNKKFRLCRFSINKIAKEGNIPNFIKRGW